MPKRTVTFVDLSDVYEHIGFTDDEVHRLMDHAWDDVSHGDAFATLIGNNFALSCILDGYGDGRLTEEQIGAKFWEIVGRDDYINLER